VEQTKINANRKINLLIHIIIILFLTCFLLPATVYSADDSPYEYEDDGNKGGGIDREELRAKIREARELYKKYKSDRRSSEQSDKNTEKKEESPEVQPHAQRGWNPPPQPNQPQIDPNNPPPPPQPVREEIPPVPYIPPGAIVGQGTDTMGTITMMLYPFSQEVNIGEEFSIDLRLENVRNSPMSIISVLISYNPGCLRVVDAFPDGSDWQKDVNIDDSKYSTFPFRTEEGVDSFYINRVDEQKGLIYFRGKVKTQAGQVTSSGVFASIKFQAIAGDCNTKISFLPSLIESSYSATPVPWHEVDSEKKSDSKWTPPEYGTYVLYLGQDVLGSSLVHNDGMISCYVRTKGTVKEQSKKSSEQIFDTYIQAIPSKNTVKCGEVFDVYLYLHNPQFTPFDTLKILLAYNPNVLRAIDYDQDNWIKEGVNIYDGSFHNEFPFDFHLANQVDVKRGIIDYRVSVRSSDIRKSGKFAVIRFKALAPTKGTTLKFLFQSWNKELNTALIYNKKDVLGSSKDNKDGVITCTIKISSAK